MSTVSYNIRSIRLSSCKALQASSNKEEEKEEKGKVEGLVSDCL